MHTLTDGNASVYHITVELALGVIAPICLDHHKLDWRTIQPFSYNFCTSNHNTLILIVINQVLSHDCIATISK